MGNPHILVAAVHYQPSINGNYQVRERNCFQNDDTERFSKIWNDEAVISAQYRANKQPFLKCCYNSNRWEITTLEVSLSQNTTLSYYNETQNQYTQHLTEQIWKQANLKGPISTYARQEHHLAGTNRMGGTNSIRPQKDGIIQFCVSYRRRNAVTKWNFYSIPTVNECIDSCDEAIVFSTLDANSSHSQSQIDDANKEKIVFKAHRGLYWLIWMKFGIRVLPGTFQRTMNVILSAVKWQVALENLLDMVVIRETPG